MNPNLKEMIKQMTLEEKAELCSGRDFTNTNTIDRLGVPSIMMSDGPHGLRKQDGTADHLGINKSLPATCFPSGSGVASSWNRELAHTMGTALGQEAQAADISIILGPAVNIKRSPLCGRNFEYFSEDPYLSGTLAASYISGVQSQGVGTSIKHFAVNNQEYKRMSVDAVVDERTLREIYLASFEHAVKEAEPWTVMAAYNKVNGEFCSENSRLLTEILRDEWGFSGVVVSDWGAVNERDQGLAAGLELEMPSSHGAGSKKIIEAVQSGKLSEEVLDQSVERLLSLVFKAVDSQRKSVSVDVEAQHQLARKMASECMVLLKNEESILPLNTKDSIAVIGAFAQHPRYQGGGSSHVIPTKLDNIYEEILKTATDSANISYAAGYTLDEDVVNEELIQEAVAAAKNAQVAVIFAGLPERYESEGFDRKHLQLPESHRTLIEAVAEVQENIVVVLSNGGPIEMPWLDKVKGVLEAYLGGQALGGAIADILFGSVNPSGKLAETFPKKLIHNPSYLNFPGDGETVEYREGVFTGYRHYDTRDVEPLFPFGFGLSYTQFDYSDLQVSHKQIKDTDSVAVSVTIKNTGETEGKEAVQLYVRDVESTVPRPLQELKGYAKVSLQPGEETTVHFELGKRAFAYYDVKLKDWHVETGKFDIMVGKSSREIELTETIEVESSVIVTKPITRHSTFGELLQHPVGAEIMAAMGQYDGNGAGLGEGMQELIMGTTLHNAALMSNGLFTEETLQSILSAVNR
ncbi:glycoside hydrolase family 3 C-terminal domain-containing protein [Paenibacillus illinoisensis]|uniref:glycoside hydrolase family 3 C-terminal domain-containing protein n=1 Tax=Paenibacillus illinoisensis TaxID=59845 RepID=UPI000FDB06EC|nr:glycoside hydrolase family 3 C-terminal domain-containing protein [Paenibacillus illinoisensis]